MDLQEHMNFSKADKNGAPAMNGNAGFVPVSKLRQAIPQCFAVSAKNMLLIALGSSVGFGTVLIPELQKEDAEIKVTLAEISWISSISLFLFPLGSLVSGLISQSLGRRKTMLLATLPFFMAWIIFYYAYNSTMIFAALALMGLVGGLLEAPVITYVAEVTQPYLRGMLSATSSLAVIFGIFTQMLTGRLAPWRITALINLVYPLLSFISLCMVPESPEWLASKGRLPAAEKALCWLRGWVTPPHVQAEFRELCEAMQKPIIPAVTTGRKEKPWKPYLRRTFYKPFLLVSIAFFVSYCGGSLIVQTFAVVIFDRLNTPIDKYTATVFLGLAQLTGTVACVAVIHFSGKRKLTFCSLTGAATCYLLIATYGFLVNDEKIDPESFRWLPTTLVIAASFFTHLGLRLIPWILVGEVFPTEVRSLATGAGGAVGSICMSVSNKSFLYVVEALTLAGTFLIFATVNFSGLVALFFMLPETEGRTLREIEEHFAGVRNLTKPYKKTDTSAKENWAVSNPLPVRDDESKM